MKDLIFEIIKFTLPSIVVLITAYLILRELLQNQLNKSKLELKINNAKIITPIRLQAYERMILFMERITPDMLFVRIYQAGMTTDNLHRAALQTVRSEYEHNLSQQVYISDDAWQLIVSAKESVLRLINTAASNPALRDNVQEFSSRVIEAYKQVEENPTETAIKFLKNEITTQIF